MIAGMQARRQWWRKILEKIGWNFLHSDPTAWDYAFGKAKAGFVIVTLTSGTKFYGFYGGDSLASTSVVERDIYLELLCKKCDDGTWTTLPQSAWFSHKDIAVIEFLSEKASCPNAEAKPAEKAETPADSSK